MSLCSIAGVDTATTDRHRHTPSQRVRRRQAACSSSSNCCICATVVVMCLLSRLSRLSSRPPLTDTATRRRSMCGDGKQHAAAAAATAASVQPLFPCAYSLANVSNPHHRRHPSSLLTRSHRTQLPVVSTHVPTMASTVQSSVRPAAVSQSATLALTSTTAVATAAANVSVLCRRCRHGHH